MHDVILVAQFSDAVPASARYNATVYTVSCMICTCREVSTLSPLVPLDNQLMTQSDSVLLALFAVARKIISSARQANGLVQETCLSADHKKASISRPPFWRLDHLPSGRPLRANCSRRGWVDTDRVPEGGSLI